MKALEELLSEAENCDLIGALATDPVKRETFRKVAAQLRAAAAAIEAAIAQEATTPEP